MTTNIFISPNVEEIYITGPEKRVLELMENLLEMGVNEKVIRTDIKPEFRKTYLVVFGAQSIGINAEDITIVNRHDL